MSWLTWQVEGQQALFDGVDYYTPGTELGWIPDDVLTDDEAYELLGPTRTAPDQPAQTNVIEGWSP